MIYVMAFTSGEQFAGSNDHLYLLLDIRLPITAREMTCWRIRETYGSCPSQVFSMEGGVVSPKVMYTGSLSRMMVGRLRCN